MILKIIKKYYSQKIEDFCVRLLYFFNTLDTYFLVAGGISFLLVFLNNNINPFALIFSTLIIIFILKFSDFYPIFILFSTPLLFFLGFLINVDVKVVLLLLLLNVIVFFIVQFCLMGIPDSIVARDPKVAFIKMFNSLFTIAPTTVSFSISVFYAFFLSFGIYLSISATMFIDYVYLSIGGVVLFLMALVTRQFRPKNFFSKFLKPDTPDKPTFEKIIILNIDGVRKDVFDSLNLPVYSNLKKKASWHERGLETVYRALTNPAFASIFTGTIPKIHGIRDNNFGQSIRTEGLPDLVPTIAYGSMHVKHFCKPYWETRIVSLPEHSVYKSDDIIVDWLKDDIINRKEVRLFVLDFSEADFLAHAYGSKSDSYKNALRRIDKKIGELINWLEGSKLSEKTGIVICSDHGIAGIDHSYLLFDSEKYVPFLLYGKGIKKNYEIKKPGKIMDICCTVSYLLGIKYPYNSRGQVFLEALENIDEKIIEEGIVERFNSIKFDAEASEYNQAHQEIYSGDLKWWEAQSDRLKKNDRPCKILDIGCGTGFVGELFLQRGIEPELFVCMDISEKILSEAKDKFRGYQQFEFVNSLDKLNVGFDVITVSSVFHHMLNPQKLAKRIDHLLSPGGIIIGSHEPNINAFKSHFFTQCANLYKKIGGGVTIKDSVVERFNFLLSKKYPSAPKVSKEEILQMTEYHSPVEQYLFDIDRTVGFDPEEFYVNLFPGYEILADENYTTCFYRPFFDDHRKIQKFMISVFELFFKNGNLFRFCLTKPMK